MAILGATRNGYVQLAVVAVVLAVGIYFGQAPNRIAVDPATPLGTAAAAPEVAVVRPTAEAHAASVTLTGTVGPHGIVAMMPSVEGGRVEWVSPAMRVGGTFEAGEVLLRIESKDYELDVEEAKADLRAAEARLERRKRGGDAARIARAQALVEKAQVVLARAELALSRTGFSLPFDGRVGQAQVSIGQVLMPTVSFGNAYATSALEVGAGIGNEDLSYLEPVVGRTATILTEGGAFSGEVLRVSALVAPTSRLAQVFLKFADDVPLDSLPLPGSFATVRIEGPPFENAFLLPRAAEQPGNHVWIVKEGVLETVTPVLLRRVMPGLLDPPGWLVRAFDAGDGVVVGPVFGAHDGMRVSIAGASD